MARIPNYRGSTYKPASFRSIGSGMSRAARQTARSGSGHPGYIYDNLAYQPEEVPERKQHPASRRKRKLYPQPRPVSMPSIGLTSFLFLFIAAAVTTTVCFAYLYVQSGLRQMKNETVSLQAQIEEMRQENDETYQKILDSVDLAEVYSVATEEYGMIQAVDNQIYRYSNKKSDMVKQYGNIPDDVD